MPLILYLANITGTGKYAIVKIIWEVFLKKHLRLTNGLSIKCTNTTLRLIKIRTLDDLIFFVIIIFHLHFFKDFDTIGP